MSQSGSDGDSDPGLSYNDRGDHKLRKERRERPRGPDKKLTWGIPKSNPTVCRKAWEESGARPKDSNVYAGRGRGRGSERPGTSKSSSRNRLEDEPEKGVSNAFVWKTTSSGQIRGRGKGLIRSVRPFSARTESQRNQSEKSRGSTETIPQPRNGSSGFARGHQRGSRKLENVHKERPNGKSAQVKQTRQRHETAGIHNGQTINKLKLQNKEREENTPKRTNRRREPKFIDIQWLKSLREKPVDQAANKLEKHLSDLEFSLKQVRNKELYSVRDWISEIGCLLSGVCQVSDELPSIIGCLQRSMFFDSILAPYLAILAVDFTVSANFALEVVRHIVLISEVIVTRLPRASVTVLSVDVLLKEILKRPDVSLFHLAANVQHKLDELRADVQNTIINRRERLELYKEDTADFQENPPNSFRHMSEYPKKEELLNFDKPFLRKNKIRGTYDNADHYLDIQYRLLREDFIHPLRNGLHEVMTHVSKPCNKTKIQDVRLYRDTRILHSVFSRDGLGYVVQFNAAEFGRLNWESSKRLIYGSFLCLSHNDFQTMLFATVSNRDDKKIKRGIIEISIIGNVHEMDTFDIYSKVYLMVESVAFFEAYKHVLKGLKAFRTIPFERYILSCESTVASPVYLKENVTAMYDFSPIINSDLKVLTETKRSTGIMKVRAQTPAKCKTAALAVERWPSAQELGLDQSQYEALTTALTKEVVVTQGPPGTGKTYIGLQLTKVLLEYHINMPKRKPILVVCFTNHALDQFLEGITSFFDGNLVRVGGRSVSEDLAKYNLNTIRQKMRDDRAIPERIFRERKAAKEKVEHLESRIRTINKLLQIIRTEHVNQTLALYRYMGDHFNSLRDGYLNILFELQETEQAYISTNMLHVWLGIVSSEFSETFVDTSNDDFWEDATVQQPTEPDQTEGLIEVNSEVQAMQNDRILDDLDPEFPTSRKKHQTEVNKGKRKKAGMDEAKWKKVSRGANKNHWKQLQQKLDDVDSMTASEAEQVLDIWKLPMNNRWRLYKYWVNQFVYDHEMQKRETEEDYVLGVEEYNRARMLEDAFVIGRADVVGMTTTGAARCQQILFNIGPRVVIVEEAAEVLEAHIITTLSNNCEHLILIGDHQQLRPNPTTYKLAKDYNLDVSLFERLINNGFPSDCLQLQHRMRPEISRLLRHIYPNLRDHESVLRYENIQGVASNVFFINHKILEQHDEDQKSHLNTHEGEYVVALCRYLIQQGYQREQITVLTTYSAQLFYIRNLMPKEEFEGVTVTVVDNYQGEENDIVILSLVRSNTSRKIGFLKIENRICVALSRAKKGFYVIGNFSFLRTYSNLWEKMVRTLEEENQIGPSLGLYCQNHTDYGTDAKTAEDFKRAPDGGCMRKCEARLECGHVCTRHCHSYDTEHKEFQCVKPCVQKCVLGHSCRRLCYEDCNCPVMVEKVMPNCSHLQIMPCYIQPENFECQEICTDMLTCRHEFKYRCCTKETVDKICDEPCEHVLLCGHSCKKKCGEDHTKFCKVRVEKTLPCKHIIKRFCSGRVKPEDCGEPCEQVLLCGHTCSNLCGQPHVVQCQFEVQKTFICGHIRKVPCYMYETATCPEPCGAKMHCGHRCSGTCGTCNEGRFHKSCSKCTDNQKKLICGHNWSGKTESFGPCHEPCPRRCSHTSCKHDCFEPCRKESSPWHCKSKCMWSCDHFTCTKECGDFCDRPPCDKPCLKKLRCRHKCVGLCGEKCLCRECTKGDFSDIQLGKENEENARFVYLEDCKHVVEVMAMDAWMGNWDRPCNKDTVRFQLPYCPVKHCRSRILWNTRYNKIIRKAEMEFETIKVINLRVVPRLHKAQLNAILTRFRAAFELFSSDAKIQLAEYCDFLQTQVTQRLDVFTIQEIDDFNDESKRIVLLMRLFAMKDHTNKGEATTNTQRCIKYLLRRGRFSRKQEDFVLAALDKHEDEYLTDNFKYPKIQNDVPSVSVANGAWVKCRKGHLSCPSGSTNCNCQGKGCLEIQSRPAMDNMNKSAVSSKTVSKNQSLSFEKFTKLKPGRTNKNLNPGRLNSSRPSLSYEPHSNASGESRQPLQGKRRQRPSRNTSTAGVTRASRDTYTYTQADFPPLTETKSSR